MLQKCDLIKFNGKVHSINYYMEETYKGRLTYSQVRVIHRETRDKKGKEDPPVESRGSERTPSLSKLLLREEPSCNWIQTQPQTSSTTYFYRIIIRTFH